MMQRSNRISRTFALVIGIFAALAGVIFIGMAIKVSDDLNLSDVPRSQTVIGIIVILALAALSWFEAYRFIRFFRITGTGNHWD
jgi:uncharacterized membrane protein